MEEAEINAVQPRSKEISDIINPFLNLHISSTGLDSLLPVMSLSVSCLLLKLSTLSALSLLNLLSVIKHCFVLFCFLFIKQMFCPLCLLSQGPDVLQDRVARHADLLGFVSHSLFFLV